MKQMSRRERLEAAIDRRPVDRVPYAVWRHFPTVDRSPAGLSQATLRFHEHYGSDFLKITPHGGYAVEAWGCVEADEVLPDGHRACASCAVNDSGRLEAHPAPRPAGAGGYSAADRDDHSHGLRPPYRRRAGVPTLFSPLSLAHKLSGERLTRDPAGAPRRWSGERSRPSPRRHPFADAALTEGVSGIFYSIQAASRTAHAEEVYAGSASPTIGASSTRSPAVVPDHRPLPRRRPDVRRPGAPARSRLELGRPPDRLPLGRASRCPGAVIGGLDQWATLRAGTPAMAEARPRMRSLRPGELGSSWRRMRARRTPDGGHWRRGARPGRAWSRSRESRRRPHGHIPPPSGQGEETPDRVYAARRWM